MDILKTLYKHSTKFNKLRRFGIYEVLNKALLYVLCKIFNAY